MVPSFEISVENSEVPKYTIVVVIAAALGEEKILYIIITRPNKDCP